MSVVEIREAIRVLPETEYLQLQMWMSELDWKRWDGQIEADSEAGRLGFLIAEAREVRERRTTPRFRRAFGRLPEPIRRVARQHFDLPSENPDRPSLRFMSVGAFWSARVGRDCRALAVEDGADLIRVWIGSHDEYDRLTGA